MYWHHDLPIWRIKEDNILKTGGTFVEDKRGDKGIYDYIYIQKMYKYVQINRN